MQNDWGLAAEIQLLAPNYSICFWCNVQSVGNLKKYAQQRMAF